MEEGSSKEGLKPGGHGDHWGCVYRSVDERQLLDEIRRATESDMRPERFGSNGKGGMAFRSSDGPLRTCVLVQNDELVSAYPEVSGGHVWSVTVQEVVPWANGLEGQIIGEFHGADTRFFDTKFYANRHRYTVGEAYSFHINALAYVLRQPADMEFELETGAKLSWRGAHAFMPADVSNASADVDEYWFHSPLEDEIEEVAFAGRRLRIYPIVMALPEDVPMSVNLYAAEHVLEESMVEVKPGDDLEGFLWLQGYLADGG